VNPERVCDGSVQLVRQGRNFVQKITARLLDNANIS